MPSYEHLGAAALLRTLGKLLRQAAVTIEKQPDSRTPEEVVTTVENLRGTAARADFLALQIEGKS